MYAGLSANFFELTPRENGLAIRLVRFRKFGLRTPALLSNERKRSKMGNTLKTFRFLVELSPEEAWVHFSVLYVGPSFTLPTFEITIKSDVCSEEVISQKNTA